MHRDEPDAGRLGARGEPGRVAAPVVPAQPHFERDGHLHGGDGGLDQGERMVEVAHQRGARLFARHLARRASHVDVDDVGPQAFGETSPLAHPVRLRAGELHDEGLQIPSEGPPPHAVEVGDEMFGRDHLGHDEARTQGVRRAPERHIRHPGHRG